MKTFPEENKEFHLLRTASEPLVADLRRVGNPDEHPVSAQRPKPQLSRQLHGCAALQGSRCFEYLFNDLFSGESAGV